LLDESRFLMKTLIFVMVLYLGFSAGCVTRFYYYHPDKTPAEIEMDYTQCMHEIDARVDRPAPVSQRLERCMKSKGYEVISEKQAKRRGIKVPEIWPPHASNTSSTGP